MKVDMEKKCDIYATLYRRTYSGDFDPTMFILYELAEQAVVVVIEVNV